MVLDLAQKLNRSLQFRLFLIVALVVTQVSLPFAASVHAAESRLPTSMAAVTNPDPGSPQVVETRADDGSVQTEVRSAVLVNMMEADRFAKQISRHALAMQARGLGADEIALDIFHYGPQGSVPKEFNWMNSHFAALKEQGIPLRINIIYVDGIGSDASTRLLDEFGQHEAEAAQLSAQARAQVENLLTTLDSLYEIVERLGAQSQAMESHLDISKLGRWAEALKSSLLPAIRRHLSQIREHLTTPSANPTDFESHHRWYRDTGRSLESLLAEYERMTAQEVTSGLGEDRVQAVRATSTLIASIVELLDSVAHRYERLAGFYSVSYEGMAAVAETGQAVDTIQERNLWRQIGNHAGLALRRFFSLPRGMTFAMYRQIFRPSTHREAIAEARAATQTLSATAGISSLKAFRQAYPKMSSDTRKILELYGMAGFRALLGLGISIGAMSYSAASHPEIVTHPYFGGIVAASWMFFTGVIGVANIDFFNQAKKYDPYRGYVSNKLFFYASSFVHSFLIALNVQQVFYANPGLNADIYQHTFKNSLLSTFAKLAPTLFIAKNRDNGTGILEKGSKKHSVHRTIFFTFVLDLFYQAIKSLNLFDPKNKPVGMILNVMALVGGVVMARDFIKTRREIRAKKAEETPMARGDQRTIVRMMRSAPLCSAAFH